MGVLNLNLILFINTNILINRTLMKKILLAAFALASLTAMGDTKFYPSPAEMVGTCSGISDNGKYAIWTNTDDRYSYMIDVDDIENMVLIQETELMDVSDDGMYVGSRYEKGKYYPGYYKDGVWTDLPITPKTLNTSDATCVTPDGKTIGGHLFCQSSATEGPGGYFPARWDWNEATQEYDLTLYDAFDYGDHQGMYITCISTDGRMLAGSLFWGFAAQLDAAIIDGQLDVNYDLEMREVPWYYKGEIWGYVTGYFINGFQDYSSTDTFDDVIYSNDNEGNFYMSRTEVTEIYDEEEGTGHLEHNACIYNYLTDEWIYDTKFTGWTTGLRQKYMFPAGPYVVVDGEAHDLETYFNFSTNGREMSHVSRISQDGKVFGGSTREFNEAIMEFDYLPFLVVLDKPLFEESSVKEVAKSTQGISVNKGLVSFYGQQGEVYTMDGRLAGKGTSVSLTPGIYVVRNGNETRRVVVK